jgi:transcriptional activator of cad operon
LGAAGLYGAGCGGPIFLAMQTFRIGVWRVDPLAGSISRGGETVRLDARAMGLLVCLAEHAGEVVSIEALLKEVWAGVIVTSDSVYQAVASLRRVLGDDPKRPIYIATVPRLGYRLLARVMPVTDDEPPVRRGRVSRWVPIAVAAAGAALVLVLVSLVVGRINRHSAPGARSIAVVPFIDMTAGMGHEYFAEGMTEEVIDKLSQAPGIQVAPPATSLYLTGKQVSVPEIARALRVAYVLDGSVRQSGTTLRVAARLTRGDDGYVVWSQSYDRPVGDALVIQADIATQVTRSLLGRVTTHAVGDGQAHGDHVLYEADHLITRGVRAGVVQSRERQDDEVHHHPYGDTIVDAAHEPVVAQESEPAARPEVKGGHSGGEAVVQ